MKVMCINNNGWYLDEGHYYGFCFPRPTEIAGPVYEREYEVVSMFVDYQGDLCYVLDEFCECGWEAECFALADILTVEVYAEHFNCRCQIRQS